MKNFAMGVIFTVLATLAGAYFCLKEGYISFAADTHPSALETKLAMAAVDASTDRHSPAAKNRVPPTDENLAAGAKLYLDHCAGCHGVPSNPDSQFAQSFYPSVPEFFQDAPDMPESDNFYIIQHGIRWTGMPAWNRTLSENQTWQIVTFLSQIDKLPPAAQKVFGATGTPVPSQSPHMTMPMPR